VSTLCNVNAPHGQKLAVKGTVASNQVIGENGMGDAIRSALQLDEVIDITTIGRSSGQPRRIEIWFHVIDDTVYLSSMPGKRSWNANLLANPGFTFHFKQSLVRDVAAWATPITDPATKRDVFAKMKGTESRMSHMDIDVWVAESPLVLVELME
tara:strand:+ start:2675 stop:3136 length:462 start_codon:yes stop_codon:yes gene_type:complete